MAFRVGPIKPWIFLLFIPGDNGPYTEPPQDFLATEPEDIGQDIVFVTNPAEDKFSQSEVTAKGGEVQHAHTAEAQSPTLGYDKEPLPTGDLHQSVAPLSEHQEHSFTEDTVGLIEKASYPEKFQPAPDENLHTDHDHEESHGLPTSPSKAEDVVTVGKDSPLLTTVVPPKSGGTSEHHVSVTESLNTPGLNATSESDTHELLSSSPEVPQEGDLPVLQEDHTPDVHLKHTFETELVYSSTVYDVSGKPEEANAGTVEEISVLTTLSHTEETGEHSTTSVPTLEKSGPPEESGEETTNPSLHTDAQNLMTATSEPIPTPDSGESTVSVNITVPKTFSSRGS